jgi:hypothetical protein
VANQIAILNGKLIESLDDAYPIGLVDGKMGLCIYYYYLSRWEEKEEYKQMADKLLDDVVSNLSVMLDLNIRFKPDITVRTGLAGVAIGISHLVKEKFIAGDINEILEEVDSHIFKNLAFLTEKELINQNMTVDFVPLLYYLYLRYTEQTSSDDKYIFQELMIKTIEMFKRNLQPGFFYEYFSFSVQNFHLPFFLYVIGKIYGLNIYNDRITKILEEHINQIISTIPVLHANRLYLVWGLIHSRPCLPGYRKEIDFQIHLLREAVDIDHIINSELKNQDIYIKNGLSGIYILLYCIWMNYPEYGIDFDPRLFVNKISNSEAWVALLDRKFSFVVIIPLLCMKRLIKEMAIFLSRGFSDSVNLTGNQ